MRKTEGWVIFVFFLVLVADLVLAQSGPVWSANSFGGEKNTFTNLNKVYAKSNVICVPAVEVDLYITEDKSSWVGGEALVDVRQSPQVIELLNGRIQVTEIWGNPSAGDYDIVVDCNRNEQYDLYTDQVDSFADVGFTVSVVAGQGSAKLGENNIRSHSWMYDSEEPDFVNEMLQLSLLATGEDISLRNATIKASGSGDDLGIEKLEIYMDENNNGRLDDGEVLVGSSEPAYSADNGEVFVLLDSIVTKDVSQSLLIVYFMKETASEGGFSLSVKSIYGVGQASGKKIRFAGLPVDSEKKTVLPPKSCLGELMLELEPNPVLEDVIVTARASGISGCQGKKAVLKQNPCASSLVKEVCSCILANGESCSCNFKSSDTRTYYACVDKNGDGDMSDFGEGSFVDLVISTPALSSEAGVTEIEEINVSEVNVSEMEETQAGITGAATGLREQLVSADSFLILLEITLLLIMFILIMILFRLKGRPVASPRVMQAEKDER